MTEFLPVESKVSADSKVSLAGRGRRLVARSLDFLIALLLAVSIPLGLGLVCGMAYVAIADAHGSLGKRWCGLSVLRHGQPLRWDFSVLRNASFLLVFILMMIPFWGWFLALWVTPTVFIIELVFFFRSPRGHRLGDILADTEVVFKGKL